MAAKNSTVTYESALSDFLSLCGFEPEEIKAEWHRVKKTFDIWDITEPDAFIEAADRLERFYDMSLLGLRKVMGVYIRELCHLTLCGEEKKKRLFTVMPCNIPDLINTFSLKYDDVYAGFPDMIGFLTLGTLFDKTAYHMNESEKRFFSPDEAHCSCCMLRSNAFFEGQYAKPDLIVSFSHYCDETWKVDEMLHELLDIPVVTIDRTQDDPWEIGMKVDWRRLRFYVEQVKQAKNEIEKIMGLEISEEDIGASLMDSGSYLSQLSQIADLIVKNDPAPVTFKSLTPFVWMFMCGCMPDNRPRRLDAIETLLQELEERVEKGAGPLPKGAPRYMTGGFGSVIDPEIASFLEEKGLCLSCAEACVWMPEASFDAPMLGAPGAEPSADFAEGGVGIFEAMAFPFFQAGISNTLNGRLQLLDKIIDKLKSEEYPIDGFFLPGHYPCRVYGTDILLVKNLLEKTGLPNMALEIDAFDKRFYAASAIKTKLEAFAEMVKLHNLTR